MSDGETYARFAAANPVGPTDVERSALDGVERRIRAAIAADAAVAAPGERSSRRNGTARLVLAAAASVVAIVVVVGVGTGRGPGAAAASRLVDLVEEVVATGTGTISVHTVETPTGPLRVPDVLSKTVTSPDGSVHEVQINACDWSGEADAEAYTRAELLAAPEDWCFRVPGTIQTTPKAAPKPRRQNRKTK
jgi:hypothetical protein